MKCLSENFFTRELHSIYVCICVNCSYKTDWLLLHCNLFLIPYRVCITDMDTQYTVIYVYGFMCHKGLSIYLSIHLSVFHKSFALSRLTCSNTVIERLCHSNKWLRRTCAKLLASLCQCSDVCVWFFSTLLYFLCISLYIRLHTGITVETGNRMPATILSRASALFLSN